MNYINLKYKPKKEVVCEYYMEPNGVSYNYAAEQVAAESSIGTWTKISTMNPKIAKKLKPTVFYINKKNKHIKIAYPQDLFELGNMSEILSSIAGNIYGMEILKNLKLMDISFPKKIVNSFPGPKFGIKGVRKLTGIKNRPLIGTIVKPKVGLNERQHAQVAYDAWKGGLDIVKDDENLSSMKYNDFYKRIKLTLKARKKAEKETGKTKVYMPNVTASIKEMEKRARFVKKNGGKYMMIDILTVGWSGLQYMRNLDLGLVIHAHRAGHAMFTRKEKHGMSMLVVAEVARLCGVDQIHIGTAGVGKMYGNEEEELAIEYMIENQNIEPIKKFRNKKIDSVLKQKWYNIKPVLAVASGGLSPLSTPKLVKIMGKDIVAQYGGGCHGHPNGTLAGAKAIKQSLDAVMKGQSLKKYVKNHKELNQAFQKWKNV